MKQARQIKIKIRNTGTTALVYPIKIRYTDVRVKPILRSRKANTHGQNGEKHIRMISLGRVPVIT